METPSKKRRWIIKIGSSLLTNNGQGLDVDSIQNWAEQMAGLEQHNIEFVLVSSGAVAAGMTRLGWIKRPQSIHELQAAAAVGQMGLVQAWESCFQQHEVDTIIHGHTHRPAVHRYSGGRQRLVLGDWNPGPSFLSWTAHAGFELQDPRA